MTRQSWTALTSAVAFVILAVLLGVLHVPFVAWAPGETVNLLGRNSAGQPNLRVNGVKTYTTTGSLLMTTVSVTRVDSALSLPEALAAYVLPSRDVLPRDVVYPPSLSNDQVQSQEAQMMDTSQQSALVAALRAAGQPVKEMPVVAAVVTSGPSNGKLQPGDLIEKVDGTPVQTVDEVTRMIAKHKVGDTVTMTVKRNGATVGVSITTVASNDGNSTPRVGIRVAVGYDLQASATFGIDPSIVGPSGGLMFSLAIYDLITQSAIAGDRIVAGTGEISADGTVSPIGGIQEKIAGASAAHATVFLVPAGNCVDVAGLHTSVQLVKVATLDDAISALNALKSADTAKEVPHC
ncbi:MAG TPA: PDZ domain-containing protein [Propionibacteriaceae bacterium]|nr:PDZ domain-containing protein [Propionibacteriaceae bacterium]